MIFSGVLVLAVILRKTPCVIAAHTPINPNIIASSNSSNLNLPVTLDNYLDAFPMIGNRDLFFGGFAAGFRPFDLQAAFGLADAFD